MEPSDRKTGRIDLISYTSLSSVTPAPPPTHTQWSILGVDPAVLPPILAMFKGDHTVCNDTAIGLKHSYISFCDSLDVF